MNKTININLAGIIFHLDEEAYLKLTTYLKSLKQKFADDPGKDEILMDIEARIAELFADQLNANKEVINISDVESVIAIMGSPEDYEMEDDEDESSTKNYSNQQQYSGKNHTFGKRLYRNPDDKMIGGVASGLAAYLGIDPTWVRIVWLILFFTWGTGVIVYLILWAAMPVAKTTAQKLQMRGEPINISNIEKSVKEEFKNVGNRVNKVTNDPHLSSKISNSVDGVAGLVTSVFKFIFLLIIRLIGFALLLAGIMLLLAFIGSLFGHELIINDNMLGWYDINGYIDHLLNGELDRSLLFFGLFMMAAAPIAWLVLLGMRMLFNFKSNTKMGFVISAAISFIGFVMVCYVGISLAKNFSNKSYYTATQIIEQSPRRAYHISINKKLHRPINDMEEDFNWIIDENAQYFQDVVFTIRKADDTTMYVKLVREAKGRTKKAARELAKDITYGIHQKDSVLLFDNYFTMGLNEKYRAQKLNMVLYLPVGSSVFIDEDLLEIIYDIPNVTNTYDGDMVNHNWIMTQNGLACMDCTAQQMEQNFEELWEQEAQKQELNETERELELKRKELERLKREIDKRKKLQKTSWNEDNNAVLFLPQNSSYLKLINQKHGFTV